MENKELKAKTKDAIIAGIIISGITGLVKIVEIGCNAIKDL